VLHQKCKQLVTKMCGPETHGGERHRRSLRQVIQVQSVPPTQSQDWLTISAAEHSEVIWSQYYTQKNHECGPQSWGYQ